MADQIESRGYSLSAPHLEEIGDFHTIYTFPELTQRKYRTYVNVCLSCIEETGKIKSFLGVSGPDGLTAKFSKEQLI